MSRIFFEKLTDFIPVLGVGATLIAIVEKLFFIVKGDYSHRSGYWIYFNPNFLATISAICISICAYKIIVNGVNKLQYYIIAVINAMCIYLTGSMFVWVALFIGVALMLIMSHQHLLLSVLLIVGAVCLIIVAVVPDLIFTRISESSATINNRLAIWRAAVKEIINYPIFGKGFYSYRLLYESNHSIFEEWHCHNIILECLLDFGAFGSALLVLPCLSYGKIIQKCHKGVIRSKTSVLIISLISGLLVASMLDMTILESQVAIIVVVICGSIGIEERLINKNPHL